MVTGREMTKAIVPEAVFRNPNGLTHRTSPTISGIEAPREIISLANRGALKDNIKKEIIEKIIILFIHLLLSRNIFLKPALNKNVLKKECGVNKN
jgi:hypothetical protein